MDDLIGMYSFLKWNYEHGFISLAVVDDYVIDNWDAFVAASILVRDFKCA